MRNGRFFLGVLLGLLLFGVIAGVSFYAYNVGMAQGVLQSATIVAPPIDGAVPVVPATVPFGYWQSFRFGHPFGFGFGFLGCLVPIFFFFLIFALFRFAFRPNWGGGWRRGGWDGGNDEIPPQMRELHRKLHEQDTPPMQPPAGQAGPVS
jgi:hypothetical protein